MGLSRTYRLKVRTGSTELYIVGMGTAWAWAWHGHGQAADRAMGSKQRGHGQGMEADNREL